ncbi:LacI family transcriptional regulator [Devosia sp.]|uniref:LacI family transcriptional regulator n=1 Tax=Devosia sp. TaxID=1871048 RepID=UPI003263AE21
MAENDVRPPPRLKRGVKPSGKPTLKTIALMTGFAVTTISRALNNAPELSQETRDRVQKIAAEIGYLPDRAALRLKTGRTNVISLVLAPDEEIFGFGSSLVSGLTASMRDTSFHLVVMPHFRKVEPIEPIRHIVRNRMADGVIFSKAEPFDDRVRFLLDNDFPFITHGRTLWPEAHPWVDFDNETFAHGAVMRLAKRGCRKVSIVLPDSSLTYSQHLREGFTRGAAEAGIASEIATDVNLDSPAEAIREYVIKRRRRPDAPEGFVCCSEVSALAVIAGLTDSGLVMNHTGFMVCKQSSPLFTQFRPGAETVFEDFVDHGERLGRLLLRRINGEKPEDLQFLDVPNMTFS